MRGGLSVGLVLIGTAWALAGGAAIYESSNARRTQETAHSEEIAQITKELDEAKKSLAETEQETRESLEEAKSSAAEIKGELEKMEAEYAESLQGLERDKEQAEYDLNDRKLRRAELAIAKLERDHASRIKKNKRALKKAEAKVKEIEESGIEGARTRVAALEAEILSSNEAHKSAMASMKEQSGNKPLLAFALGLFMLFAGVFVGFKPSAMPAQFAAAHQSRDRDPTPPPRAVSRPNTEPPAYRLEDPLETVADLAPRSPLS